MPRRFFIDHDLRSGVRVDVPLPLVHRLGTVLRLGNRAPVVLFNGRDGDWQAEIVFRSRKAAQAVIGERLRPHSTGSDIWLVCAPIKRRRLDFLVEKATELGVRRVLPVATRFAVFDRVCGDRLATTARAAAEQCGRGDIPEIAPVCTLDALLGSWPSARHLLVCSPAQSAPSLHEALVDISTRDTSKQGGDSVCGAIMVGPEGGWSADEQALFAARSFARPVSLGPRILRSETAAMVALAGWQAILGDGADDVPAPVSAVETMQTAETAHV